jgi:hypothetical protein
MNRPYKSAEESNILAAPDSQNANEMCAAVLSHPAKGDSAMTPEVNLVSQMLTVPRVYLCGLELGWLTHDEVNKAKPRPDFNPVNQEIRRCEEPPP